MLVVLADGIDLSDGAIVIATSVFVAAPCDACPELAPLILKVLIGAINGSGVHTLIVTLGTSSVLGSMVLLYTICPPAACRSGSRISLMGRPTVFLSSP